MGFFKFLQIGTSELSNFWSLHHRLMNLWNHPRPSIRMSVRMYVRPSRAISETVRYFFLKLGS